MNMKMVREKMKSMMKSDPSMMRMMMTELKVKNEEEMMKLSDSELEARLTPKMGLGFASASQSSFRDASYAGFHSQTNVAILVHVDSLLYHESSSLMITKKNLL